MTFFVDNLPVSTKRLANKAKREQAKAEAKVVLTDLLISKGVIILAQLRKMKGSEQKQQITTVIPITNYFDAARKLSIPDMAECVERALYSAANILLAANEHFQDFLSLPDEEFIILNQLKHVYF